MQDGLITNDDGVVRVEAGRSEAGPAGYPIVSLYVEGVDGTYVDVDLTPYQARETARLLSRAAFDVDEAVAIDRQDAASALDNA